MRKTNIMISLLILFTIHIQAQNLTEAEKNYILSNVINKIEKLYPFQEVAKKTIAGMKTQISNGFYNEYNSPGSFAERVTNTLEEFSNDKHLSLLYDPELSKALLKGSDQGSDYTKEEAKTEIWNNYGFKELKILDGNVGYLNLSVFFSTAYAGKIADISMGYFTNSNALIIDLRQNGGGWGDMVDYLLGYLIDTKEPLLLNITQSTLDSSNYSEVIPSYVPGKKLTDIPIYILTSSVTASAAEAFTSHLKYLNKNVTIVGKKTKGAENPVEHIAVDNGFVLQIPVWKKLYSKNPNIWEGVGIKPDIEVKPDEALNVAQLNALEKLIKIANDKTTIDKYQWAIDGLSAGYDKIDVNMTKKYTGKYNKIKITYKDGKLYYQSGENQVIELIPISDTYFILEGIDYFRIKFIMHDNNVVLRQIFIYGNEKEYLKTE